MISTLNDPTTSELRMLLAGLFFSAGYRVTFHNGQLLAEDPLKDDVHRLESFVASIDIFVGEVFGYVTEQEPVKGAKAVRLSWRKPKKEDLVCGTMAQQNARGFQLMARNVAIQVKSMGPPDQIDWKIASGEVVCEKCRLTYLDHPEAPEAKWLHLLCDGRRVKL